MENLSKEQKAAIASEYMQSEPHDAAISLMFILGKMAKEHGVNLTYSATSKDMENPTTYRLHASTVTDKEKMEKEFFVDITFYSPKNNLEKMLHDEFRKHEHTLITYAQIPDLKAVYESVIERHRKNKGRATAEFRQTDLRENKIWIEINKSLRITLVEVTGDFWTEATNRKENRE